MNFDGRDNVLPGVFVDDDDAIKPFFTVLKIKGFGQCNFDSIIRNRDHLLSRIVDHALVVWKILET